MAHLKVRVISVHIFVGQLFGVIYIYSRISSSEEPQKILRKFQVSEPLP